MSNQSALPPDDPPETNPLDLIRSLVLDEQSPTEDILDRLRAALED